MSVPDRAPRGLPSPQGSSSAGPGWAGLAAVAAVALVLRLHGLTAGDVWVDEANSILTAQHPVPALLERLRTDSSPPFYYLALRGWAALVGESPAALRALSVAIGTGLVVAVGRLGRRWVGPRGALLAAWVVAVSPMQVYHSQQVRMYALLALLALVSLHALARTIDTGARRFAALWVGSTLLALYTHNFAFHLLPLQALWILASGTTRRHLSLWSAAAAVGLLAYLPWLPSLLEQLANRDHYAWYEPLWRAKGVLGTAYQVLLAASPGGELVAKWTPAEIPGWFGLPALAAGALAGWGAVRQLRNRAGPERLAVVSAVAVPLATSLALSSLLTPHLVPGRVDQLMAPFFALLVGAGLAALPGRSSPLLAAGLLAVPALAVRPAMYPDFAAYGLAGSDRAAARALAERARPGDVLLCTSLTRAPLAYYLGRAGAPLALHSFPRDTARHLGSQNDARWLADPGALAAELEASLAAARSDLGPGGRLWVARVPTPINRGLAPPALRRRGWESADRLGPFQQTDLGERVLLEAYEPPGAGRGASTSTPKKVPGRSGGSP